jgi:hypothetical protein
MNSSQTFGINFKLAQKHLSRFSPYLSQGELLLNAGSGIEMFRESVNPGLGDGFLGVTNQNVHVLYEDNSVWTIRNSDIELVAINRVKTFVPRVRELRIISSKGITTPVVFHGGKAFANEISLLIPIQRLTSGLTEFPPIEPFDPAEWIKAGLTGGILARESTATYINRYVEARDSSSPAFLDFIPLMSTTLEQCVSSAEEVTEKLISAWEKVFDPYTKEFYLAGRIPKVRSRWNPYSLNEIEKLVANETGTPREILGNWYRQQHDLLEGSFRAAWHLIKSDQYDLAKSVLVLGASLSAGSERLILQRLNDKSQD